MNRLHALLPQAGAFQTLQIVINAVPDGVLLAGHAGATTLNPAALALFGMGNGPDAPGFPPGALRYPSGQAVPPGALPWTRAALTQTPTDWTPYLAARDTHALRPVEISARPTPSGAVALVRDVSARQNADARDLQARQTRHVLAEAARRLARTSDFQTLCHLTTDAALALLPPDVRSQFRALLCTFDGQGQPLVLRAMSPEAGKKRPKRHADTLPPLFEFDAQSPLLWKVYVDRQTVASADIDADPLFAGPNERALLRSPRGTPAPITSALMLPLLSGAAASGHLLLTSALPAAFEADTQDALALLAALSASALARAQLGALRHTQDDRFALLHQAACAACAEPNADTFADILTHRAADALNAAFCTLSRVDSPASVSACAGDAPLHFWGTPPPDAPPLRPGHDSGPARCPCTRTAQNAIRRGLPASHIGIPNPALGECPWRAFGGQSGTHSALAVPLRRGDTVCGALAVFRHGRKPFSPQEISLAETFAALASLALPTAASV